MWIRSQDREVLLKCNQVYYFNLNKKHIIATDLELVQKDYDYQPLGYYKTKERALEVLDEIQQLISKRVVKIEDNKIQDIHSYDKVYEMPKE